MPLTAGPLRVEFDPRTASLRYARVGDVEVVRAIYPAVRDHYWNTLPHRVANLRHDESDGGFRLTFDCTCGDNYAFRGTIDGTADGTADGTVTYRFDGRATAAFRRNRIGLCVLHPAGAAGRPCMVEHSDGRVEATAFPAEIAPHQPFRDVRALRYAGAEVRLAGDEFETEDQRNWTDASFKTYPTPLRLAWPVGVAVGERVEQSVTLRVVESSRPEGVGDGAQLSDPSLTARKTGSFRIGLCCSGRALTQQEVAAIRAINPMHLRVDLVPGGDVNPLRLAIAEAQALDTKLEVALLCDDDPQPALEAFAALVAERRPLVASWLIARRRNGVGNAAALRLARRLLPAARFGIGTNNYFAELNRDRPDAADADFVFFSVNPQVHAFDDDSLKETLDGQRWAAEAARRITGKPVAVTPITLRPRFNPYAATAGEPADPNGEFDPRLALAFGSGWTAKSAIGLLDAGVESVTYHRTAGPCGVVAGGVVRPVAEILAMIRKGRGRG